MSSSSAKKARKPRSTDNPRRHRALKLFSHPELRALDLRSRTAARIWEVRARLVSDRGGEDHLSTAELITIERAASLTVQTDSIVARWAEGEPVDLNAFATLVNCLNRTLAAVGLKRVARDVSPGFRDLIAQRTREKAEEVVPA